MSEALLVRTPWGSLTLLSVLPTHTRCQLSCPLCCLSPPGIARKWDGALRIPLTQEQPAVTAFHLVRSAPQAPPSILTLSFLLLPHILLALSQADTRKNNNNNLLSFGANFPTRGFGSRTRHRTVIKKRFEGLPWWRSG